MKITENHRKFSTKILIGQTQAVIIQGLKLFGNDCSDVNQLASKLAK